MRAIASPSSLLVSILLATIPASAHAQGTSGPTVRDSSVGYIDGALLGDQLRLRYDGAYDLNRPTRAEFFWPRGGPTGPGPRFPESAVHYQDVSAYVEKTIDERFSAFVELPVRFLNPEINDNTGGMADMNAGFKYALLQCDDLAATFQFRAYFPTGDADRGLGNNHYTVEPSLLVYKSLSERLAVESELRYWVPIEGTDLAGNILRYGVGVRYDVYEDENVRIVPVAELVGWTAVSGRVSMRLPSGAGAVEDAAGDTILNAKIGCRLQIQEWGDLYLGYGRPLTGDRWYENTYRVEFRVFY